MAKQQQDGTFSLDSFRARKRTVGIRRPAPRSEPIAASTFEQCAEITNDEIVVPPEELNVLGETVQPKHGGASITYAFEPDTLDQRNFLHVEDILALGFMQRRMFVEIVLGGIGENGKPLPPPNSAWFLSLTVSILIPGESEIRSPIKAIRDTTPTSEGLKMVLVTEPYPFDRWLPTKPTAYKGAKIRLVGKSNIHWESPYDAERLILAQMRL